MLGRASGVCSTNCHFFAIAVAFGWLPLPTCFFKSLSTCFHFKFRQLLQCKTHFKNQWVLFKLPEKRGHFLGHLLLFFFLPALGRKMKAMRTNGKKSAKRKNGTKRRRRSGKIGSRRIWAWHAEPFLPVIWKGTLCWRNSFSHDVDFSKMVNADFYAIETYGLCSCLCILCFLWLNFSTQHMKPTCLWP